VPNHHKKHGTVSWAEYRNGGFLRVWAVLQLPPAEQIKQGALYISGIGWSMVRVMVL